MKQKKLMWAMALVVATGITMNAQNTTTTPVVRRAGDVAATLRNGTTSTTTQTSTQQEAETKATQPTSTTQQVTTAAQAAANRAAQNGATYNVSRGGYQMNQNPYGYQNILTPSNGGFIMPIITMYPIAVTPKQYRSSWTFGYPLNSPINNSLKFNVNGTDYYYKDGIYVIETDKKSFPFRVVRPPKGALLDPILFSDAESITFSIPITYIGPSAPFTGRNILCKGKIIAKEIATYNNISYFYKDGIFFVIDLFGNFVVVEPPMGSIVKKLPSEKKSIKNLSQPIYQVDKILYREISIDGKDMFEVIGYLNIEM